MISLPIFPRMNESDVDDVIAAVQQVIDTYRD
jgi:dTDP-4-amino-4,6-dideoxygalactose transaminase